MQIGTSSLVLDCDERLKERGYAVLSKLAELDRQGPSLKDGSRVQFGWAVLTLQSENGSLRVYEPDYLGDALRALNRNLDLTLEVIADQVKILRGEGCEGLDARYDQFVLTGPRAIEAADIFLTRRDSLQTDDSGWFLGDLQQLESGPAEDELEVVHVFDLLKRRRSVIRVLALPPGYAVVMRGDAIDSIMSAPAEGTDPGVQTMNFDPSEKQARTAAAASKPRKETRLGRRKEF